MNEDIQVIAAKLGLTAADQATFLVDRQPGGRHVFVALDYEAGAWTAFVHEPAAGRTVLVEGRIGEAE